MPPAHPDAPRAILLATDLSARCDRALDRATLLSKQWRAQLVALHVLEPGADAGSWPEALDLPSWRRPPSPVQLAERQLREAMNERPERVTALVESGDPAPVIMKVAETQNCDLIVTGVARDQVLGRWLSGTTVDRLAGQSPVPVLTVKGRARGPYRHVVVATDFSEASRVALDVAARWFDGASLTLFHAYDAPLAGFAADRRQYQDDYRSVVAGDCAAFLDAGPLSADRRGQLNIVLEQGTPHQLLAQYVLDMNVDLVVVGPVGRGAILQLLVGSVARAIHAAVTCDVLIVREPRTTPSASPA